jgi:hypothetical protein
MRPASQAKLSRPQLDAAAHLALRARNAVTDLMSRRLLLPNIYYDAAWQPHRRVDVLAVDRTGASDVHAIAIQAPATTANLKTSIGQLLGIGAHYLWLAAVQSPQAKPPHLGSSLLNPNGMGRIGVIRIVHGPDDRLRADRFTKKTKPDKQYR